jgi:chromosome segregation ATPase
MGKSPEIPEEFDSEAELKRYVGRLRTRIEVLDDELDRSEREELKQELDELEATVAANDEEIEQVHTTLQDLVDRLERIELHGTPSDVGLQDNLRNPDFDS